MSDIESSPNDVPRVSFAASLFHHALDEHRAAFLELHELINDDQVIALYLANREKEDIGNPEFDEKTNRHIKRAVRALRTASVLTAREISYRQAIVVAVTFAESMLQEFFHCLFGKYPLRMYEFLPGNNITAEKGKIDLKDLVQAESTSDLIYVLAERAASAAVQGNFRTIVKNLQRVTKNALDASLLDDVVKINELRNKIVHELSEDRIEISAVEMAFQTIFRLIFQLEQIALELSIPVWKIGGDDKDMSEENKL